MLARRAFLAAAVATVLSAAAPARATDKPTVTVYKSPT
jgi:hypothetical protein